MSQSPTIRLAEPRDAADLLVLLRRLVDTSRYTQGTVFDIDHVATVVDGLLTNPLAGFFVAERAGHLIGTLALLRYEDLISGEPLAAEVFWYVDRAYRTGVGAALLAKAEQWAWTNGAGRIQMLAPEPKFESFYARRGYVPSHRVFERSP